jgi:hypothetical protein
MRFNGPGDTANKQHDGYREGISRLVTIAEELKKASQDGAWKSAAGDKVSFLGAVRPGWRIAMGSKSGGGGKDNVQ